MKKYESIFDLKSIDDLPVSLKKYVKPRGLSDETQALMSLFDIKSTLTLAEIIVGLYRQNKIEKSKPWVASATYNLTRRGLLKKIASGTYTKVV